MQVSWVDIEHHSVVFQSRYCGSKWCGIELLLRVGLIVTVWTSITQLTSILPLAEVLCYGASNTVTRSTYFDLHSDCHINMI